MSAPPAIAASSRASNSGGAALVGGEVHRGVRRGAGRTRPGWSGRSSRRRPPAPPCRRSGGAGRRNRRARRRSGTGPATRRCRRTCRGCRSARRTTRRHPRAIDVRRISCMARDLRRGGRDVVPPDDQRPDDPVRDQVGGVGGDALVQAVEVLPDGAPGEVEIGRIGVPAGDLAGARWPAWRRRPGRRTARPARAARW